MNTTRSGSEKLYEYSMIRSGSATLVILYSSMLMYISMFVVRRVSVVVVG